MVPQTALEWLLTAACLWSVFFLYFLFDVPVLLAWVVSRVRHRLIPRGRHAHRGESR